jgi:transcriptional regulator with XRE-family HTH domain
MMHYCIYGIIYEAYSMPTFAYPAAVTKRLSRLGKLVQAAREERGLSQVDFARRIGTSRTTVQRLEAGNASVVWGTVMTACWMLNLPSDPDALSEAREAELLLKGEQIQRVRRRREASDDF